MNNNLILYNFFHFKAHSIFKSLKKKIIICELNLKNKMNNVDFFKNFLHVLSF